MLVDDVLKSAVENQDVPFVMAMAGNSDGVTYTKGAGQAAPGLDVSETTVFRIFSMTKAIGSLAALILIDQGKLSLDMPVAEILTDWNKLQVLEGWDGDTPVLRAPKTVATVRHLTTHRSGLEYEFWNPDVPKYLEATGNPSILSGLKSSLLSYPLTFDPGARWGYGPSTDWLGQIVEAVDGRRIDQFCREEIFAPLGMSDTAFEPDGLEDRLADVSIRGEDGTFGPFEIAPPPQPELYGMGHAAYSTPNDYMRFLRMVLRRGELDGERLLSEQTAALMYVDQMEGKKLQPMMSVSPSLTADVLLPGDTTHSAAFVIYNEDVPQMRRKGTVSWAGVCNTHYWVDPTSDLCAVIMTQSLPFAEPRFFQTYANYEMAIYART
ncbi:MAG: serine hydrolase domain-containing protein [Pseudomonadota bacterium]